MTTPDGRNPQWGERAGREDAIEGRTGGSADEHPDSRVEQPYEPVETSGEELR